MKVTLMARTTKELSATEVKSAKAKEKPYRLYDGKGMHIEIRPNGSKWWRLKYKFNGKETSASLGTYPSTSLLSARKKRDDALEALANGINPFAPKEEKKILTFREISEQRLEAVSDTLSEAHIERMKKGFKKDVYDAIGDKNVDEVTAADIIGIMQTMLKRGAKESARKTFYSIGKTYKWAVSNLKAVRNPCADIDVKEVIGAKSDAHYPIITDNQGLKLLLNSIDSYKGHYTTKMALKMITYTFVRPYNIRHAEWAEVDFKESKWLIPASKMKTRRDLIVPLSSSMIELLKEVQQLTGESKYILPSSRGTNTPMSDMAMVNALRRMGYDKSEIVAHSFRGIFSTIAHEKSTFNHQVIETQLAHSVGNSVSKAYNRAEYLNERVKLMQWWADYLDEVKQ